MLIDKSAPHERDIPDNMVYHRYLPEHLRKRYLDSVQDRELLHLNHQIALLDVRITQLLESMDEDILTYDKIREQVEELLPRLPDRLKEQVATFTYEKVPMRRVDEPTWDALQSIADSYMKAAGKQAKQNNLDKLIETISRGQNHGGQWKEINEIMENRRKLVVAEQQRKERAQGSIPLDRVVDLLGFTIEALREAVLRHVPELETQELILADASEIYRRRLGVGVDSGSDEGYMEGERAEN